MSLFVLLAAVLVSAQGLIVQHGAKFGDSPHDHNGQACIVSVLAKQGEHATSASALALAAIPCAWGLFAPPSQRAQASVLILSAPPRGPPS